MAQYHSGVAGESLPPRQCDSRGQVYHHLSGSSPGVSNKNQEHGIDVSGRKMPFKNVRLFRQMQLKIHVVDLKEDHMLRHSSTDLIVTYVSPDFSACKVVDLHLAFYTLRSQ